MAISTVRPDGWPQTTIVGYANDGLSVYFMTRAAVERLVVVTGIGSGETRGHGGWFYNWFIFPLFTRNRHEDKDRQEALIEASELDWTIVRPAPFSQSEAKGALQVFDAVPARVQLTRVHPVEVAAFILDEIEQGRHRRKKPFIGHLHGC